MNITPQRTLQTALGFPADAVDGKYGNATRTAVSVALARMAPAATGDWRTWSNDRQALLCLQAFCQQAGFNPGDLDGLWGTQTDYASGQLAHLQANGQPPVPWRAEPVAANPNGWPLERQDELVDFYGPPGESRLVSIDLPYPLRLSWETRTVVTRTRCNARVKDSLGRVLQQVLAAYGQERIQALRLDLFGGGFNLREKRGGSALSTHAWGIAFDFDPDHNQLKWTRDRASFARPEYDDWWRCWENEGWVSLGRTRNYDWMHVQAARV
jgi:hypothetical protein